MICRLCLMKIEKYMQVALFESESTNHSTETHLLIEKYLRLKIFPNDSISTYLCFRCGAALKDFDTFFRMVIEKQQKLENDYLSVRYGLEWPSRDEENKQVEEPSNDGDIEMIKIMPISAEVPFEENILDEQEIKIEDYDVSDQEEYKDITEIFSDDDISLEVLKKKTMNSDCSIKEQKKRFRKRKVKGFSIRIDESKGTSSQTEIIRQNEEYIANHMKLVCDLCSMDCETFGKLRTHFWEIHNEKSVYVKCCNNKYRKPSKLVNHLKWHQNPDAYKCDLCNKQLKGKDCLDMHMAAMHNGAVSSKMNSKESSLSCPQCGRQFRNESFMKKHIAKHENGQVQNFNCDQCGKRFINIHLLRRHIEGKHEDLHPYVCDMCGKSFKYKHRFDKHMLEHRGIVEKPIQCDDCGLWLKNEHTFKSHRITHDTKDVPCSYCGKICASKIALQSHISYMHKQRKLFQCKICEKSFKKKKDYNEHLAVHTGALLYSCQYCTKEFRAKSNMYVHVKRSHTEEWINAKMAKSNDPTLKQTNGENF